MRKVKKLAMSLDKNMTVSEYIAQELLRLGVDNVFGYPGANITYLIDAISLLPGIRYVQTYHEQGAAFAANGYSQSSGTLGVAISSSGPGALNLVTGIANAYCDSIATLYICGDLSHRYRKNSLPLRQDGFQSADVVSIVQAITKYAVQVQAPDEIRACLERAIFEATNGRHGPVLLSIPHWIQRSVISPAALHTFDIPASEAIDSLPERPAAEIVDILTRSRRPLILLGGGCVNSETKFAIKRFLDHNPVPVVASLCGLSAISHCHPAYVGFIGDYGHRHANLALAAADCLIVLGSRMDERQVGFLNDYRANKTIIHVDIDPSELLPCSEHYVPIWGRVSNFLNLLEPIALNPLVISKWGSLLRRLEEKYPVCTKTDELSPGSFLSGLFDRLSHDAQIFVDVGLHQMCTAQSGVLNNGKQLYFSGGLGSMGYALPAAIGGHFARPKHQTICIAGDGGLMMSLPELQTIARERSEVKIFVLNNHCLGMVRNHQQRTLNGRTFGSVDGYLAGDLKKISSAFDLKFFQIAGENDIGLVSEILSTQGPLLVEVLFPKDMMPFPACVDYPIQDDVHALHVLTEAGEV